MCSYLKGNMCDYLKGKRTEEVSWPEMCKYFHLHVSCGCSINVYTKEVLFCFHLHVSCGCSINVYTKVLFCFHLHVSCGCSITVYTKEVLFLFPFACFMWLFYHCLYKRSTFLFPLHVSCGCSITVYTKEVLFCFHLHVWCGCSINVYTKKYFFLLPTWDRHGTCTLCTTHCHFKNTDYSWRLCNGYDLSHVYSFTQPSLCGCNKKTRMRPFCELIIIWKRACGFFFFFF